MPKYRILETEPGMFYIQVKDFFSEWDSWAIDRGFGPPFTTLNSAREALKKKQGYPKIHSAEEA